MPIANYHSHTSLSDGKLMPEDYIVRAVDQGLKAYGFSDHAPIPGSVASLMPLDQLSVYLAEVDRLKEEYQDRIQVYKSLEVDYIPGVIDISSRHIEEADLDYTIGAVHFVDILPNGNPWSFESSHERFQEGLNKIFGGDIRFCIGRYYETVREMVRQHCPDIVAHFDRIKKLNLGDRYFRETDQWYRNEVAQTLQVIASSEAVMEVNTKGYYVGETDDTYPGRWILQIAFEMGIPVHLASDAHHPDNITRAFDYASEMLAEVGYKSYKMFFDGIWQDIPLEKFSYSKIK